MLSPGRYYDNGGELRPITRTISWDGYVRLTFDGLRPVGTAQPQVTRRLQSALEVLKTVAPPEHQPALDYPLHLLDRLVKQQFNDNEDIDASLTPDQRGIGSGQDVTISDRPLDEPLSGDGQGQRSQQPSPAESDRRWDFTNIPAGRLHDPHERKESYHLTDH